MTHFLILCMVLNLGIVMPNSTVCNTIIVENKTIRKDKKWIKIEADYPKVYGIKNSAFKNSLNQTIKDKVNKFVEDSEKLAKETYAELENEKTAMFPFEAIVTYSYDINGSILSLVMNYYSYLGGAHGSTFIEAINVDIIKGVNLKLADLFKDKKDYKQYILKIINEEMKKEPDIYFSPSIDEFDESNFYLNSSNELIIYFNQYDIAPYSTGIVEFKILIN